MKNIFKKTAAVVLAATMTAGLAASVGAAQPVRNDTWSVSAVNTQGAPSGTGSEDACYMYFSTNGIEVYCNNVSNTANGGTGKVTITCSTSGITMASRTLTNSGQRVVCYPEFTGIIEGVRLRFTATASYGNIFNASGTVYSIP